jgi:5-methyltetrahydropteroyltriglutamate--homocysteine methyltransferase
MTQKNSSLSAFLPTEPVGSIPRPAELIAKLEQFNNGTLSQAELALAEAAAVDDTIAKFEATGSTVVTDGERCKLPHLTKGPFRYSEYAVEHLKYALTKTSLPVKQPVISASALSLLYPPEGLPGYSRDEFLCDLVNEVERDIRQCLEACADSVQMDFTEARMAIKIDPSLKLFEDLIEINNRVLDRFSFEDRKKIGIHSWRGSDYGSTRSADIDYEFLLTRLFRLHAGRFYIQLSSEKDRPRVLSSIRASLEPNQLIFVGVVDPTDPHIDSPEEVRDRILEAARFLPLDRLGTTDDCGFASFPNNPSISRETAFAKIKARIDGTALAREALRSEFLRYAQTNQSKAAELTFPPLPSLLVLN